MASMYKHKSPLNMTKKPASQDWHRADVVAAVHKRGMSLQRLGFQHGYKATGVLQKALYCPTLRPKSY